MSASAINKKIGHARFLLEQAIECLKKAEANITGEKLKIIEIELPAPPNRANSNKGWRLTGIERNKYQDDCVLLIRSVKNKLGITVPIKYVEWKSTIEVDQYYDADNLMSLMKWPMDSLIKAKLIESDRWMNCRPVDLRIPTQIINKTQPRILTLQIYPRLSFEENF